VKKTWKRDNFEFRIGTKETTEHTEFTELTEEIRFFP
jgi:hypothetical protein